MGSCPPSNPFSRTPVRAFWPFTPRPAVLPLPEPMPRPTRLNRSRAPSLSRISLSLTMSALHLHQVGDLADHAPHRRSVLQLARPVHLVEAEPDQRLALAGLAADGRPGLGHLHRLLRVRHSAAP